ncbi:MAG: ATP-binding protein [Pseudomonas sp.]|jgi:signal transduction histidine kinase|nr:ATP-binding protein [Pseudomonas sp.]
MVKHIDFSTLMASTVHDMKNVIAAVSHAYESLLAEMPEALQRSPQARLIEQEALRLDAMLMQLLGLYKLEHGQLLLQPVYYRLDELFEDLYNRHRDLLAYRNIDLQVLLDDPDLEAYFDVSLMGTVLDNALGNALNYCKKTIRLHAQREDNGVLLTVSDDGAGYPTSLLGEVRNKESSSIDRNSGSTGLGLYFAANIVAMHDQDQHPARLELSNDGPLSGACMKIWLPLPSLF